MGFLSNLFGGGGLPQGIDKGLRDEAEKLIVELIEIGHKDDYLAEHPGGLFNGQCHNIRARAIGLYWGLRSFAFCPAPLISYLLWRWLGPQATFLIGGIVGMLGTAWFWLRVKCEPETLS